MDINTILSSLSIPNLGLNWVDLAIIVVLIFYAFEGYALGFLAALLDLISFVVSFFLGLTFYGLIGNLIFKVFSIPGGFANAIGFFIVAFFSEIIINFILKHLVLVLPLFTEFSSRPEPVKKLNSFFGVFPSVLSGILLLAFILTMIIILPVSPFLKNSVSSSKIGSVLVTNTQGLAKDLNMVFGGAVNESLAFLTVEPQSNEIVNLNFKISNFSIDYQAENKMFEMVNQERTSRGIAPLEAWDKLQQLARAHCEDMFRRGYFSHYTPEGLSPFDRMAQADISYTYAGENLALAPNVDLAMNGFMQSPGHRANILSSDYHRVGIGVINGGIYGEMFCQEFTN
ncbi:MAG: CvpA family protein [Patescibacteria group bacterium]|nr:CvpA family protein [Patescibacteria group bacterium]